MRLVHCRPACGILITITLASAAVLASVAAEATVPQFVHEVVDASGQVGYCSSLRLDKDRNPHISYYDYTNGDLKYAVRMGEYWHIETVDSDGDVGWHCALALDSEGNPHISYHDLTNGSLKYATKAGGIWVSETVESSTSDVGRYSSIAVDAHGNPHVSYLEALIGRLHYATKSGGTWSIEIPDAVAGGEYTSIVLDEEGNPHLVHHNWSAGDLRYGVKVGSQWYFEDVYTTGDVGEWTSLTLDSRGHPHVSFTGGVPSVLYYAEKTTANWNITLVSGSPSQEISNTSIEVDALGTPYITYFENIGQDLHLTYYVGGTPPWTSTTLATAASVGWWSSLEMDAHDNLVVSYLRLNPAALMLGDAGIRLTYPTGGERWAAGSEQHVAWKGAGYVNIEASPDGGATYSTLIAGVTGGEAAIGVPDWNTDGAQLRVVREDPHSTSQTRSPISIAPGLASPWWSIDVEDPSVSVGVDLSLTLDVDGNPHIAYATQTPQELRHATREGSNWTIDLIDDISVFSDCSIALNHHGEPRISYHDALNGHLKFASQTDGVWSLEIVDDIGNVGRHNSLAMTGDVPHIAYSDWTNHQVKYAVKTGTWQFETAATTPGVVDHYCSLALDGFSNPHIAYRDGNVGLRYAWKDLGGWQNDIVAEDAVTSCALALDAEGDPHIAYRAGDPLFVKYAVKKDGTWHQESVLLGHELGHSVDIDIDREGNPHIATTDAGYGKILCARKKGGVWAVEVAASEPNSAADLSMQVDAQGNPRVAYSYWLLGTLRYASAAIELEYPDRSTHWWVGSNRGVSWKGSGLVDVYLSSDGGSSWEQLASQVSGRNYRLTVPHRPSKFSQIKLERAIPYSVSTTTGFFTIETGIELLMFTASPPLETLGGAVLSWETNPGPEDIAGYRLERCLQAGSWRTILAHTIDTGYHDAGAQPGCRYRLYGINGLREEFLLGETTFVSGGPLSAWPLPYQGGELSITFATASGLGGGPGQTEVALYNALGQRLKTLASGSYPAGYQTVSWDGRDESGRQLSPGIYFLRSRTGGEEHSLKVVVLR